MCDFKIVEINESGKKFVNLLELPDSEELQTVITYPPVRKYSHPYGTAISTYLEYFVNVNGYLFSIYEFSENKYAISSGSNFALTVTTFEEALTIGKRCVNAIQQGYVINWVHEQQKYNQLHPEAFC